MRLQRLCFLILPLLTLPSYADSVSLGTAAHFGVLGGSAVTNTDTTTITEDLGVYPGSSITDAGSIILTGTEYVGGAVALQAHSDLTTAYNTAAGLAANADLTSEDLGGKTLLPGVYKFDSSAGLTGTLTLNAEGLSNAVFVFQIGSTLTTATSSNVIIINPGSNDEVIWQIGSSATLGTGTAFEGNILALASITLNPGATIDSGSALALNGAVTLDDNTITTGLNGANESSSPPVPEPGSMTLLGAGLVALAGFVRRQRFC